MADDCLACNAGTFAASPGSANCSTCPQGTYAVPGSTVCGWFTNPYVVPTIEELLITEAAQQCQDAIGGCFGFGHAQPVGSCADRVSDLLHREDPTDPLTNVRPDLWQESEDVQAVIFCLEVNLFGFDVCKIDPSFGWGIGQLSRSVLSAYCQSDVQAALAACPPREHDTCCTCFSDNMPVLADDGYCCGDCADVCSESISQLGPDDECHGVPTEPCSPLRLVAEVETLLQTETATLESLSVPSLAKDIDLAMFCACRAYADKEYMQHDDRTCEDANGADTPLVCDSSGGSSSVRFVTPGLVVSDPADAPTNPLARTTTLRTRAGSFGMLGTRTAE